jgi:serine protease Do
MLFLAMILLLPGAHGQGLAGSTSEIYQHSAPAVIVVQADGSAAAGFILHSSGLIATTFSAVEGAEELRVRTSAGEVFDRVRLVAEDRRRNIAVLDIDGFGLPAVQLGNSNTVEVRQPLIVLGVTVGGDDVFQPSISEGTISSVRMEPAGFRTFQVQVALSGEDAGSPVLARSGEVIGIVSSPGTAGMPVSVIPVNYLLGLLSP